MAALFGDTFGHYATVDIPAKYTVVSGNSPVIAPGEGRSGSSCLKCTNSRYVGQAVTPTGNTAILAFAMSTSLLGAAFQFAEIRDGIADRGQLAFVVNADGSIAVYRIDAGQQAMSNGSSRTLLGTTSAGVIFGNTQHHVQILGTISATVGVVTIVIDGNTLLSLTAKNTLNPTAGGAIYSLVFIGNSGGDILRFSDFVLFDGSGTRCNTLPGNAVCDCTFPIGAGASTQWTPNTGANWQCVDDPVPDGDATIVTATTAGLEDTYARGPLVRVLSDILFVQTVIDARQTTGGGTRAFAHIVRVGGASYASGDHYLPATFTMSHEPWMVNPSTSANWTVAGVNAMLQGQRVTI